MSTLSPLVRIAVAVSAGLAVAIPALAADLATRFGRISFGLGREQVAILMETPPASVAESTTFGITKVRMKWIEGPRTPGYVVVLLGGRVIQTESCDPNNEC